MVPFSLSLSQVGIAMSSVNVGYGFGVLNVPEQVMRGCPEYDLAANGTLEYPLNLPPCFRISDSEPAFYSSPSGFFSFLGCFSVFFFHLFIFFD